MQIFLRFDDFLGMSNLETFKKTTKKNRERLFTIWLSSAFDFLASEIQMVNLLETMCCRHNDIIRQNCATTMMLSIPFL